MTDEAGPVLSQINLVARDMEATAAFYRRLGLTLDEPPAPWDQHHCTVSGPDGMDLEIDSTAFATVWNEGWPAGDGGVVIGFRLRTRALVDETYWDLTEAGCVGQQPPYDAFWGARYAVVKDPDGNSVGLMSPIDPAMRAAPPPAPA